MPNLLESLASGLRSAAGVLNPRVQEETFAADERANIMRQQQTQFLVTQVAHQVQTGAMTPEQATQALAQHGIRAPEGLIGGQSIATQAQSVALEKAKRQEVATQRIMNDPNVQAALQSGKPEDVKKVIGLFVSNGLPIPAHIESLLPKITHAPAGSRFVDQYGNQVGTDVPEKIPPIIEHNYPVKGSAGEPMVQPHISLDKGVTWNPLPGSSPSPKFARQVAPVVNVGDHSNYTNVQPDGQGGWLGLNKKTNQMEKIPAAEGVAGPTGLTPEAIESGAARYRIDGTLPPNLGRGTQGYVNTNKILNRAAEMANGAGDTAEESRIKQIVARTSTVALQGVTKDLAALNPYKEMLDKNANIAIALGQKIANDKTSSAFINRSLLWLKNNMQDKPDVAEYLAQMHFVEVEAARVLSNPRLVGQLTDSAIADMKSVVSGNMTLASSERVLHRMMADGDNRVNAMRAEKESLLRDISGRPRASAGKTTSGGATVSNW